jgi:RimJ/RimL family protein N-acetyltransferase
MLKTAIDQSLEHLRPWMPWAMEEPEELQAKIERLRRWRGMFDLGKDFVYGLFNPEEDVVLGSSGLHTRVGERAREIGYWIHADHINQGLATEAAGALTRIAFEVDAVVRVEIHCDPRNARSAAVPRKLGFAHEATLRERTPDAEGRLQDAMIWSLFRDEYPNSAAHDVPVRAWDAAGRRIL